MNIRKIHFAGEQYVLAEEEKGQTRYMPVQVVPIEVVSGMSRLTYSNPKMVQQVLDALSPFQLMSKMWAAQICATFLDNTREGQSITHATMPGSWLGQQSAFLCRASRTYSDVQVSMIDSDYQAVQAAKLLHTWDSYHNRMNVDFVHSDIFSDSLNDDENNLENSLSKRLIIWNGLEHFDPEKVKKFLQKSNASICLQSTSMKAEDHSHTVNCIEELLEYLPDRYADRGYYAGSLEGPLGVRYMVLAKSE